MKKVELNSVSPIQCAIALRHEVNEAAWDRGNRSKKFWMGMSYFLPGGGAEYAYEDSPTEKIYFILDGEMTVKSKDETFVLRKNDSIFIGPNEGRSMINETNQVATVLVVISYQ